jgi:ABC-type uncharacterized transport system substrate-binding protein
MIKYLTILLVCFAIVGCGNAGGGKPASVRVLVVHSYHFEYPWTKSIDDGIMDVLRDKGYTVEKFFMDTKQNTNEAFKIKAGQAALAKIDSFKPVVVIASDDNAQEYMGKFLVNRKDVSLVFCGVNLDMKVYNYPAANVTGVLERPFVGSTLDLLQKVTRGIETVTIFTDKSPTSKGFINYITSLELDVKIVVIIETDDFDEWKRKFETIKGDAVVTYLYHTIHKSGKPVSPRNVMKWTTERMERPWVGFFYFAIEDGVLLGHVESGFEHGELAARRAVEIIDGKKAVEIPVITASKGLIMVNDKTARKLGIDWSPIRNVTDRVIK